MFVQMPFFTSKVNEQGREAIEELSGTTCIFHRSGGGVVGWLKPSGGGARAGHMGPLSVTAGYWVGRSGCNRSCYALSLGPTGDCVLVL